MKDKYKLNDEIPSKVLCARLEELADAVAEAEEQEGINREFYGNIRVRFDKNTDLILNAAAERIKELSKVAIQLADEADLYQEEMGEDSVLDDKIIAVYNLTGI